MQRWGIFPFKVEKLFHSLPEYISSCLRNPGQNSGKYQLIRLTEALVLCVKDNVLKQTLESIAKEDFGSFSVKESANEEEALVQNFIYGTWQSIIYEPYVVNITGSKCTAEKVFQIIDNEENWNKRLDNINKTNLGLTGLAGIGLGLIFRLLHQGAEEQQLNSRLLVNTQQVEK
jgi:hypothetical protein